MAKSDNGDEINVTDMEDQEEFYTAEQVRNKILEIKSALKTQATSVRKPLPYTDDTDIKLYLEDFECYRDVVGLAKGATYKTFLSYLPDKHRIRLRALHLSEEEIEDWDRVQQVVIDTLTSPVSKLKAKIKLDNAKQESTESVIDFLERLQLLVDHCYDQPNQENLKDRILKELLVRGLKDDVVSIDVLTQREDLSRQELVKLAMKKELAIQAKEYVKRPAGGNGTVTVLSVSDKPPQGKIPVNNKPKTKQRCYNCGSQEHFVRACPIQNNKTKQTQRRQGEIRCWTCNGPHLRRDCPRAQQRFIPHRWNSFSSAGGKTENNYRYNSNNR